ncbi:MAG: cobalamin-dependent protein, partial [Thermodesulfobacteriota bacterium]|nr:cobalamin-dependent protein [Thermodesulfobacteriota bacterium]
VHDIGKNIVALMLRNHGFEVVDLGKDVSAEIIIREAARIKPSVIGLSALMTTTMVNMKEVIELAQRESLDCKFMVGGAVVTKVYAESIGAHYARDGVEAVRVVEKLI